MKKYIAPAVASEEISLSTICMSLNEKKGGVQKVKEREEDTESQDTWTDGLW